MKYIKKQIPVEAIQVTKEFLAHSVYYWEDFLPDWVTNAMKNGRFYILPNGFGFTVNTLEGTMLAPFGSYLIKGVDGELYPCREEVFKKSYEMYEE